MAVEKPLSMAELKLRKQAKLNSESQKEGATKTTLVTTKEIDAQVGDHSKQKFLNINLIDPNPFQPRKEFDIDELKSLAESISINGVIQPIVVRAAVQGRYELIAGERRLRASKLLEKTEIPVVIEMVDDLNMAIMALAENLDRADLSDYETGMSLANIQNHFQNKTKIAEYFRRTKKDVDRLLAFNSFPYWLKDELNSNPRLISKTISQPVKAYLESSEYKDEVHRPYFLRCLRSMGEGALTQALFIDTIKRQIRDASHKKVSPAGVVKKSYNVGGKNIGSFSYDEKNLNIKLNAKVVNSELADELFELINERLGKLKT